jgi:hypothetical protein
MIQIVGGIVIAIAVIILMYCVWSFIKTKTATTTTTVVPTTAQTTTTISTAFDTSSLTTNLGYIELLSKVDVVTASPDAIKACEIISNVLWQGAIVAWKAAQETKTTTSDVTIKTAKVTTTDGTIVEVPLT